MGSFPKIKFTEYVKPPSSSSVKFKKYKTEEFERCSLTRKVLTYQLKENEYMCDPSCENCQAMGRAMSAFAYVQQRKRRIAKHLTRSKQEEK